MKNILAALLLLPVAATILFLFFREKYDRIQTNHVVDAYNSLAFGSDAVNETFNHIIMQERTYQPDKERFEQECLKANFDCKAAKEKYINATFQMAITPYNQQAGLLVEFADVFQSQIADMKLFVNNLPNVDDILINLETV